MGKNRGSVENLGEYGWWKNWEIFGSLGSWVKDGGIWKKWESVLGGGRGVEECMGLVGTSGNEWGRCRIVWGAQTLFYTSIHTSSHLPQQFFTTLIPLLLHFPIFPHTYFIIYTPYQNF